MQFIGIARALVAASLLSLSACGGGGSSSGGGGPSSPAAPVPPVALSITHKVSMSTSKGVIELGLDANHAPTTVANFLKYTNDGFYKGTLFHRVVKDFVIQGGGVVRNASGLVEKTPTYAAIALESNNGLSNLRGTLAMARTAAANSATSQFYINTVDNLFLNYPGQDGVGGYAVFGKVTAGMDVVDAIAAAATSGEVPLQDITITEVKQVP